MALSMSDVNVFGRPPRRPGSRSSRRQGPSIRRRATQAIQRYLAAAGETEPGFIPQLQRYPY
jgi:hypothetical protein